MSNGKVLVIDDDAEIRGVIQDYLEEQGYQVVTASDGEKGIHAAKKEKPDLIILDVEMPELNGYEVCKKMREDVDLIHTPIVMLTGRSQESDEVSGFHSGADDYVSKPFKPARLLARIQSSINRSQRELDANALTHLPGNVAILDEIQNQLQTKKPFSVMYFDLNNFKAFNDRYGFLRGDSAIRKTAEILSLVFSKWKKSSSFLGHVGGDDFVAVVNTHDVEPLCLTLVQAFDQAISELYDEDDRKRGMITSINRKGEKVDLPIMGLAIAVVTNRVKQFKHPGEIAFIAGDLKKRVKNDNRSSYLIDRRN